MPEKEEPRRERKYKGLDGSSLLVFTEYTHDYEVTAQGPGGEKAKLRISKGEARTFGRFLTIRRTR